MTDKLKNLWNKKSDIINFLKELTKRFNVIDFMIIGLIFISFIALLYKITLGSGDELKDYRFTYVCEETPAELTDAVTPGALCADGDTGEFLGEVLDAEEIEIAVLSDEKAAPIDNGGNFSNEADKNKNSDTSADTKDPNQKTENTPALSDKDIAVPKKAIRIHARTNGYEGERGVTIGDNVYLKGKRINLIVDDTVFEVYISHIEPIETEN